jgi:HTH-type transcriptional regulator/antitoxin HigA
MATRTPAEVFPPGQFLADELEARGWTQTEFAEIIGRPQKLVNDIVNAKRSITPETAADFAAALGTSAQLWMNLESTWQLSKVPPRDDSIARAAKLRERFPVREMVKRRWILVENDSIADGQHRLATLESSITDYFGLKSIDDPIVFKHAARRNYQSEVSVAQWAWIFRVNQLATALHVPRYSEATLRAKVPDLERLMTEPEEIRHVPRILMECGVRLVIVEPIPGSEIQGVCFWIENKSPVIGLTLKGDQIDKFWFDFWHEISHVLNGHGKDDLIIEDFDQNSSDENEKIANREAASHCVPPRPMKDFILRHNPMFSEKNMLGFARIVKRHPGIVAGQIQRLTNRWDLFKRHQPRIRHIITQTALTDGYGVNS